MKIRFKHLDELRLECKSESLMGGMSFSYSMYDIVKSMCDFFDGKTVIDVEESASMYFLYYKNGERYYIHRRWVDIVKPSDDICELFDNLIRDLQ